ncbi:MAG: HAMP domain-containing histidine kinase [Candidatus Thorarchaeota archaeon]|nr:MAG: HAMP domain-containing histidine kinase [Candidatus Thorarchaeota archaeon]
MDSQRRMLTKVIIVVPLAILATFLAIEGAQIVSNSNTTRVGVHSLLAYWISIPAAVSVLASRRRSASGELVFVSALIVPVVIHIGNAMYFLLQSSSEIFVMSPYDTIADITELTMLGLLFALASLLWTDSRQSRGNITQIGIVASAILVPLVVQGATWSLVLPSLNSSSLVVFGVVTAAIGAFTCFSAALLCPNITSSELEIDSGYLMSSLLLMGISSLILGIMMMSPSDVWIIAEDLQIASFFLIALSIGVPFLKAAGFGRRTAYVMIIGLALLAYLPFLVTIIIESLELYVLLEPLNRLAYSIIHLGAGSLSAMMAYLLYAYSKRHPSRNHYPLILTFGVWTGVALVSVSSVLLPDFSPLGEPIVPYVVGSLLTLPLLYLAIRWTHQFSEGRTRMLPSSSVLIGFILLFVTILIGEITNQLVLQRYGELSGHPASNAILLASNLLAMFAFTYLVLLLAREAKGSLTIEIYVVGFLSMWVIPNVLKSYYPRWTPGWWVSEILIFIGLLVGPGLLGLLYARAMREAEESHSRASLYADLMMHDITNYNQMTMTALELLGAEGVPDEVRERLARDARQIISLSEQLISNVRLLSRTESHEERTLEPMDLVLAVVGALDDVTQEVGSENVRVQFKPERHQAYVMANENLIHVFINLLIDSLQHPPEKKTISVEISPSTVNGQDWWQVRFGVPGRWIEHNNRPTLFDREVGSYSGSALGLLVARLLAESLGGVVTMEDRILGELFKGTVFVVSLPAYKKPIC